MSSSKIILCRDDITKMNVDAIVNAANSRLAGGGGVDGAIHRAAGPELLKECQSLNGCKTGSAKITRGYNLPAKFVIHAVGPVWRGGDNNEAELLKSCYQTSLAIAVENGCRNIAFPNISTGIYGYPKEKAAKVAIGAVKEFIKTNPELKEIYFVCFDDENYAIYDEILNEQ